MIAPRVGCRRRQPTLGTVPTWQQWSRHSTIADRGRRPRRCRLPFLTPARLPLRRKRPASCCVVTGRVPRCQTWPVSSASPLTGWRSASSRRERPAVRQRVEGLRPAPRSSIQMSGWAVSSPAEQVFAGSAGDCARARRRFVVRCATTQLGVPATSWLPARTLSGASPRRPGGSRRPTSPSNGPIDCKRPPSRSCGDRDSHRPPSLTGCASPIATSTCSSQPKTPARAPDPTSGRTARETPVHSVGPGEGHTEPL